MNYVEKTYEEIFESMLQDSLSKGLISHAENFEDLIKNKEDISNYYVMDKAVIAQMIVKIYQDITKAYESSKVEYAEGTDLDEIGIIVGIPRPGATYAMANVTFTLLESLSEDIQIPEGIRLSTADGIEYVTVEPLFLSVGEIENTISAIAARPGVNSKIGAGKLTTIVSPIEYNFSCNNESSSTGGSEPYSDDEYRYLIMNWTKIRLKGSLEAYENYFASFDGIDSYSIVPNWDGSGTVKIILDPGTSYQLQQAYNDLQSDIVQITEDITMSPPIDKFIDIYASVNVDIDLINPYNLVEKKDIQARILSAIKCFIDGGYRIDGSWYPGLMLGEDFIPHKLAVFLDDEIPELKDIKFKYPQEYIPILDEEIGKSNNITIEMI